MDKYIKADSLIELTRKTTTENSAEWFINMVINSVFVGDTLNIVRCKDCVNSVCIPRNIGEDWFCDIKYNEWGKPWATSPEGFCDCGERKDND